MIPFQKKNTDNVDQELIALALEGSTEALSELVERHQRFIYNVALKMVREPDDAADLTQEVLIKMVTKLGQYRMESSFTTWLYRMVLNHFLTANRKKTEIEINSFEGFSDFIDNVFTDGDLTAEEQQTYSDEIITVRNKCMSSMLLCLDRDQRIVLILGSIFNLKSNIAAEILEITPENFRKQLSRAKADLYQFMDNKCGLINAENPCRCQKKTKGFLANGLLSPQTGTFRTDVTESIASVVDKKNRELDYLMEQKYVFLFMDQPYADLKDKEQMAHRILSDPLVGNLFQL